MSGGTACGKQNEDFSAIVPPRGEAQSATFNLIAARPPAARRLPAALPLRRLEFLHFFEDRRDDLLFLHPLDDLTLAVEDRHALAGSDADVGLARLARP